MNILVCIKQVPGTTQVDIDPVSGVLKRDGVDSKMNPYDLYALETALRIKESHGADITVITMGPPQAQDVIREAYMMGVDRGFLLSDRRFGGADVLATSYTLAQGIRSIGHFDLIICGKQTTDGDTAQVGAELAEFLDIPHAACVSKLEEITETSITAELDLPLHTEKAKILLPCLITVEKGIFEPRLPSYKRKLATQERTVAVLTLDDMPDKDPKHYGLNGSPTQVRRIFPPESHNDHQLWTDKGEILSGKLFDYLNENKFLQKLR